MNAGDSVSDLIYKQDILAGYESMLTVKVLMMEYGMYEDAAFHQSYVNRALTKTMDYRSRTKNFESLSTLFGKLVLEDGLNDMDLLGHEPDYYYNQQHYQELQAPRQQRGRRGIPLLPLRRLAKQPHSGEEAQPRPEGQSRRAEKAAREKDPGVQRFSSEGDTHQSSTEEGTPKAQAPLQQEVNARSPKAAATSEIERGLWLVPVANPPDRP